MLAVTSFDETSPVFNITNGNSSFSVTTPGHWNSEFAQKTIDELNKLLELRSQNDIELYVQQVRKKRIILINDCSISSLGTFKTEISEELKNVKYNDLEDMVYRMQLTYDEFMDLLDKKNSPSKKKQVIPHHLEYLKYAVLTKR